MDVPKTAPSAAEFLASVEILSPFTRDEIERLAEQRKSRFFSFGDTVCNAGDAADGLFVIKTGSVRMFTEEHGKEISMGVRKARRGLRRYRDVARPTGTKSSVRASAKTELLFIPRAAIEP